MIWQQPIRRMPFEATGFISAVPVNDNIMARAYNRQYWRALDKAAQARADSARICNCGAENVHDFHQHDCWARPLRTLPCERAGFQLSGVLPYKWIDAPATRWFAGGRMLVLNLKNALFKASATRKELNREPLTEMEMAA